MSFYSSEKVCLPLHRTNKKVLSLPEGGKILFQNLLNKMLPTEYEEREKEEQRLPEGIVCGPCHSRMGYRHFS